MLDLWGGVLGHKTKAPQELTESLFRLHVTLRLGSQKRTKVGIFTDREQLTTWEMQVRRWSARGPATANV